MTALDYRARVQDALRAYLLAPSEKLQHRACILAARLAEARHIVEMSARLDALVRGYAEQVGLNREYAERCAALVGELARREM